MVDTVAPTSGDVLPDPWMSWIAVSWTSSLAMPIAAVPSPTTAPVTLDTLNLKASLASTNVSPTTLTSNTASLRLPRSTGR